MAGILYRRRYDIGVVEVRPEGGRFAPGAPEAVCIIEADVQVDFEAPADYVEPPRVSPASTSPLATSPLTKSPLAGPTLGAPKLDGDSSDEEMGDVPKFEGAGFRLDGKAIKAPKHTSPGGAGAAAASPAAAVKVGVRIGGDGSLLGGAGGQVLGRTLSGATVPLAGLGASSSGGGGSAGAAALGAGIKCLGGCGVPPSVSSASSAPTPAAGAAGSSSGDADMVDVSDAAAPPKTDGFKRLGLAAEAPKQGDDYWASLGGGNKMR